MILGVDGDGDGVSKNDDEDDVLPEWLVVCLLMNLGTLGFLFFAVFCRKPPSRRLRPASRDYFTESVFIHGCKTFRHSPLIHP